MRTGPGRVRKEVGRLAARRVLSDIKRDLDGMIGERVRLKANRGRRKVDEREGVLEKTYPHIFVVKIDDEPSGARRVSFSYADVLTETVELEISSHGEFHKVSVN
jgi:uncharacterized protein Veg